MAAAKGLRILASLRGDEEETLAIGCGYVIVPSIYGWHRHVEQFFRNPGIKGRSRRSHIHDVAVLAFRR
jgi:hypothetical protein